MFTIYNQKIAFFDKLIDNQSRLSECGKGDFTYISTRRPLLELRHHHLHRQQQFRTDAGLRYSQTHQTSQQVAAFTTSNACHRSTNKTTPSLGGRLPIIQRTMFTSSESLNSVDSGNFSSCTSRNCDRRGNENRTKEEIMIKKREDSQTRRHNSIKRVIISEKIEPYQLKIIHQRNSRAMLRLNANRNVNTNAREPTTTKSNKHTTAAKQDACNSDNLNDELNEEDVEFLLANTGFSLDQIRNWYSEFITKCKNGQIAYEQFKVYYRQLLPAELNERHKEELIRGLFRLFDIDNDGYLNYAEFLLSFWIRCRAPLREKFTWIFNMLDADRNGALGYDELYAALRLCGNYVDLSVLAGLIKRDLMPPTSDQEKCINILDESTLLSQESESDDNDDESDRDDMNSSSYTTSSSSDTNSAYSDLSLFQQTTLYDQNDEWPATNVDRLQSLVHDVITLLDTRLSRFSLEEKRSSRGGGGDGYVNISREQFLFLCERYEPLRKLIIPIRYFYDATLCSNETF